MILVLRLLTSLLSLALGADIEYEILPTYASTKLIGEVIAGIHSGCDVMPWEGRCDLIVYDSSQFGSGMWDLRGRWDVGRRTSSLVSTQLKDIYKKYLIGMETAC